MTVASARELWHGVFTDPGRLFVVPSELTEGTDPPVDRTIEELPGYVVDDDSPESRPDASLATIIAATGKWKLLILDHGEGLRGVLTEMCDVEAATMEGTFVKLTPSPLPDDLETLLEYIFVLLNGTIGTIDRRGSVALFRDTPRLIKDFAFGDIELMDWAARSLAVPMFHAICSATFCKRQRAGASVEEA